MHTIFITSPAGSGTHFALALIQTTYGIFGNSRGHMRKDIEDGELHISVLRNPYDSIASGAERWIVGSGHINFVNSEDLTTIDKIDEVKKRIGWEEKRYREFFKDIKSLDCVKIVSFELLIENPDKFLQVCKELFNIKRPHLNPTKEEILKAASSEGRGNRIPRKESGDRKIINDLVLEMYPKETWECWKIYSELKAKLDEQGL
jgi:hypothetical protein